MNIEDKLPKAEDVLKEVGNGVISKSVATKAMHEYARRLLDVEMKDTILPSEQQIKDQMYQAIEIQVEGIGCADKCYEQGVVAALLWILGETDDKPIE